jgi:CBS domain-containing protein
MLTVRDLMSPDVVTISPDLQLRDAMALLLRHHVSGAPVVAGDRVVGVVSATDMLEYTTAAAPVPAYRAEQSEDELAAPEEWDEGAEPPSTYFSEWWPDAGADVVERMEQSGGPEWDALADHTVAEVMTRSVCALRPDTPVAAAADYMLRAGVHRALVMDQRRLLGILTTTDFVRAVARGTLIPARAAHGTSLEK